MSTVSMTPPPPLPSQPAPQSPAPAQAPPPKHAQQPLAKTGQPPGPAKAATKDSDDDAGATKAQPHFGKALDDAKGKPVDDTQPAQADSAELTAALPVATPVATKPTPDATRDGDDKDAAPAADDGTSLATAMLALIGIPPKVAVIAGDALGKLAGQVGKGGKVVDADASVPTLGDASAAAAGQGAATTSAITPVVDGDAGDAQAIAGLVGDVSKHAAASAPDSMPTTPAMAHAADAPQVAAPPVQLQSTQAATTPAFAQELGDQIAWLGGQNIQQARIRLHPEDLGQLDVKVSVEHGKVDVAFAAQHPGAVAAVQQTLSQLDAMLAHHGLSLGHAEVSQQQAGRDGSYAAQHGGNGENVEGGAEDTAALPVVRVSKGLVDDFA
jgi:flagellar hook-length control protein FliK